MTENSEMVLIGTIACYVWINLFSPAQSVLETAILIQLRNSVISVNIEQLLSSQLLPL